MSIEVIAHNIRSLFNVGAFFRNGDAFGIDHLYLTGYTATPPREEITKTALGSTATVSWSKEQNIHELIKKLKNQGKIIVGFESNPDFTHIKKADLSGNIVLLFGNEPDGIPKEILDECTSQVYIPMQGEKTSINVSVANGIALFYLQ